MCEKVGIFWRCIYFYMHFFFLLLAFVIFGIIKFIALLSMHVCSVALYRFVVLHNTPHLILLIYFLNKSNRGH
jgi:hypothetical protein